MAQVGSSIVGDFRGILGQMDFIASFYHLLTCLLFMMLSYYMGSYHARP